MMRERLMVMAGVLAAVLMAGGMRVEGRGANTELYVVPAPAGVVIDGSLDDWDLSGYINSYVIPETRETQSARLAMMYDEEALYIGGIVRDSSPMMNRHDPLTSPSTAWDADVCQIFFSLNPDDKQPLPYSSFDPAHRDVSPVATMLLWYFTDREEPSLAMYRGMGFSKALRPDLHENGHVPAEHFEAAYQKGEDGLSYTFEYRIPWSTLAMQRVPEPDDTLAASLAVFWSRPDGLKTAGGAAWAWNVMSRSGFPFQDSGCWGTLKFAPEGDIPREWVTGHLPPEKPLPLTFTYELPREGEATIQIFDEKNTAVRILVPQQPRPEGINTERWDGLDDHGNPLPAGRYTWRGQVHDPIKPLYRFSVHNSGQPPYPTDDNKGGWGGDHGVPRTVLALDDGMILAWDACEYGWGLIRVDLEGRKRWGSKQAAAHLATDGKRLFLAGGHSWQDVHGVTVVDASDSRGMNFQPGMPALLPPPGGEQAANEVTGLACDGEYILVAYGRRNLIASYDLDGNLKAQWDVPGPGAMALDPDGALLVLSEGKVVRVLGTGASSTAIDSNRQPSAAVEMKPLISTHLDAPQGIAVGADGTIFVANRGGRQDVSVFAADGTYLRSVGKAGGRPAVGTYDASGMYQAGGIGVDAKGRLWVAETTDFPKRISVWDTQTGANLKEFFGGSEYFAHGHIDPARPNEIYAHNVIWEIDWERYTTKPLFTIWRKISADMAPAPRPAGYGGAFRLLTADNGRQFGWGGTDRNHSSLLYMRDGDRFRPVAGFVNPWNTSLPGLADFKAEVVARWDAANVAGHHRAQAMFWMDANGDGLVQPEELTVLGANQTRMNIAWVTSDLTIGFTTGHSLKPESIDATGRPVYNMALAESGGIGGTRDYMARLEDGSVLTFATVKGPSLVKRGPDGKMLWNYPDIMRWHDALGMPISGPGRLWGMTGLMGVAGEFFAHQTYLGPNHIFTLDGGYVAAVLEDGRLGGRGAYEGQPEGQSGSFVKLDLDGQERYFIIHGGQDVRVWEVIGLDTIQPLPGGEWEHDEQSAALAAEELAAWQAAMAGHSRLVITRGRESLEEASPVGKSVEGGRSFEARLAVDEANLYLQYDVTAPHGLVNAMPEEQLIFRGGNLIDLQIATDPAADPERTTPAAGDVRLLVTRKGDAPFAMLYRPKVAGFEGDPIVLRSPTGTEPFDSIEQTDRVGLEYARTETGFSALVTVPLDLIGWQPVAGQTVRMDVGYIFGNSEGTRAAIRAYWNNNSFSANVVDDIPNESRLEPAEWGGAEVE